MDFEGAGAIIPEVEKICKILICPIFIKLPFFTMYIRHITLSYSFTPFEQFFWNRNLTRNHYSKRHNEWEVGGTKERDYLVAEQAKNNAEEEEAEQPWQKMIHGRRLPQSPRALIFFFLFFF